MLAGDAAGFIDPIFSTGVFLAVHSGNNARTPSMWCSIIRGSRGRSLQNTSAAFFA
jgi:hypothetical protein